MNTAVLSEKLQQKLWKYRERRRLRCRYTFADRSKGLEKMVMVLAGYKDYLYDPVFRRLKSYLPDDIDVCIITSGKFDPLISDLCEKESWSYLSTKDNYVSLVQNVAIHLHPNAKYIFKLDEDIFICEGFFERLMRAYLHAQEGQYMPGVMAPLIPLNGYGHVRVLEKLGLTEVYTERFEKPVYAAGPKRVIEHDDAAAKFFWGEGAHIPSIDEMNRKFGSEPLEERACPIRFSIGAILFERSLWEEMHYFMVKLKINAGLGVDEEHLCSWCVSRSRPIMVSENCVAGHFSFGPQNAAMREYFDAHRELW